MKKYEVKLEKTTIKLITVIAIDNEDAYQQVLDMYTWEDYTKADSIEDISLDNDIDISVLPQK